MITIYHFLVVQEGVLAESYRCRFFVLFQSSNKFGFSQRNRITFGDPSLSMLQIQNPPALAAGFLFYSKAQTGLDFL
ncbi:hypothetical protein [Arenibacter sp. 6A1]|uniref:hypothetical protein n=1 Tax=Arenibacter sp. 6A1 TaxID=2720391 RepID=UPI00197C61ED|nr:hypothetical protein [Arenibacter sp. 6A1]